MNTSTLTMPTPVVAPLDMVSPIASDLEEVERILARSLRNKRPRVAAVVDHVRHYRGKRLRPVLLLLTARAFGKVIPAHHTLAAVVEMIHTATLVHDDVLDGARMRRRVATVNSVWGVKPSILLGDYLFTHAFHLASTIDATACRLIGEATDRVCEGELSQVMHAGDFDLTEDEYFDIIDGKTAALTACACRLGAHFAGASTAQTEALGRFGQLVGQAFQIADDLLDLVGDEKATGKSLGTDLEQGKLTLPLLHLLHDSPDPLAARAREALSAEGGARRSVLLGLLDEAGSLEYTRRRALELSAQARAELQCIPPSACRSVLEAMADRVVYRET